MKHILLIALFVLASASLASAQVTLTYTFTAGGVIKSAEVNSNFSTLGTQALNRQGGTMTGTLTTQTIGATSDATYDLGTSGTRFRNAFFSGTITSASQTLNLASAAVGDLLYLGSSAAVTRLPAVATGSVLLAQGVGVAPVWGLIPVISSTYYTSLSGANLTGLNASQVNTGTLPLAQIPAGVALLGTANVFTVRNDFLTYTETKTVITPGATPSIDLSLGTHFTYANSTTPTFSFTNPQASGKAAAFVLAITGNGTSHPPVWPAAVKWAGGTAPTVTTTNAKIDLFTFISYDGGTTWLGLVGGQNF